MRRGVNRIIEQPGNRVIELLNSMTKLPDYPITKFQKSICALILMNRAWRIRFGTCQTARLPGTGV
jgi:hypothetical protein